jgi:hypothetical protein
MRYTKPPKGGTMENASQLTVNCSMLCTEPPLLDRPAAARAAGSDHWSSATTSR